MQRSTNVRQSVKGNVSGGLYLDDLNSYTAVSDAPCQLNASWLDIVSVREDFSVREIRFCYIYVSPHYLFDLLVDIVWSQVVFFQKQVFSFFFLRKCHVSDSASYLKQGSEESLELPLFLGNEIQNFCKSSDQHEKCLVKTLGHHNQTKS